MLNLRPGNSFMEEKEAALKEALEAYSSERTMQYEINAALALLDLCDRFARQTVLSLKMCGKDIPEKLSKCTGMGYTLPPFDPREP